MPGVCTIQTSMSDSESEAVDFCVGGQSLKMLVAYLKALPNWSCEVFSWWKEELFTCIPLRTVADICDNMDEGEISDLP